MSYFKHHVFVCTNQRDNGEPCCHARGGSDAFAHAKERIAQMQLNGPGGVRINKAGCLGRCDAGPVLVVYPEETWYGYVDNEDIEEIVQEHLVHGRVVERLKV